MKFNCFHQLGGPEARELRDSILRGFYARYPEVQKAVNYDSASFGELTEKTRALLRQALDRDATMQSALENIAHGPLLRTATAFREMARATLNAVPSDGEIYAAVSRNASPRPVCTEDDGSLEPVFPEQIARARWPEETVEHRAMRAAFCDGAALSSQTQNTEAT